jgi:murein L,D-transpeptidase YafK
MRFNLLVPVFLLSLSSSLGQNSNYKNYTIPLQTLVDSLKIQKNNLEIQIDKSDYKLSLVAGDKVIKEYPVVFGGNPTDDKLKQGDNCTPEGTFKIKSKYPHKSWSKFMWIDYPTSDSWLKHNQAKRDGKIPKNAQIGGEIGIHGVPKDSDYAIDKKMNWTLGCISLKNKDVDEIYNFVNTNTLVKIQK